MKTRIGLAAIVIILLAGWLVLSLRKAREPEPTAVPGEASKFFNRPAGALPTPDDWASVAEEEIEDWIDELSGNSFDIVVSDGESFLTDGYEVSPGVFRFTEITVKRMGEEIRIDSRLSEVALSGEVDVLSSPTIVITPGLTAMVAISSGEPGDGHSYSLEMMAEEVGGDSIRLTGKEEHR